MQHRLLQTCVFRTIGCHALHANSCMSQPGTHVRTHGSLHMQSPSDTRANQHDRSAKQNKSVHSGLGQPTKVRLAWHPQRVCVERALQGACLKPSALAKADKETAVKQYLRTLCELWFTQLYISHVSLCSTASCCTAHQHFQPSLSACRAT